MLALLLAVIILTGYRLYRIALQKPIPGIPYNEHAAKRLMGDLPDALEYQVRQNKTRGASSACLVSMCKVLNTDLAF